MDTTRIRYDVHDGVATITLARPDLLNAFDVPMMREMIAALDEVDADEILFQPVRSLLFRTEPPHPDAAKHAANVAAGKEGEAAIAARFADLDARLGGAEFFCGALSVADIAMFMTVLFTQRLSGPKLDPYPHLAGWYRRLLARPAFGKVAEEIEAADRELSPALAG